MIENLKNLHDARYCAAVGISLVSFDLDEASATALSAAAVHEITEWLSGMETIGRFGLGDAASIKERSQAASVDWVQVPLAYDEEEAAFLGERIVFEVSLETDIDDVADQIFFLNEQFPEALFLCGTGGVWDALLPKLEHTASLWHRCIIRYDEPEAVFHRLTTSELPPYAICLGHFATEADGQLDYDACDHFLARYEQVVLR